MSNQPNDSASTASYEAQWRAALTSARQRGLDACAAIKSIEASHPGLREKMLDEVNANRKRR